MSETTKIEWADHTGGPYLICTEKSPGCLHCYARKLMEARLAGVVRKAYQAAGFADWETRAVWGDSAPRVLTKGFWTEARRLNRKAAGAAVRPRMFPSMIDWLDDMPAGIIDQAGKWLDVGQVRADFLRLIYETPNLNWLLLTKRPENFSKVLFSAMLSAEKEDPKDHEPYGEGTFCKWLEDWRDGFAAPPHVWLGASVEDGKRAEERVQALAEIAAAVRFLSVEPMLEAVDLLSAAFNGSDSFGTLPGIHLVIFGGESGPESRPCNVEWIRDGVKQCRRAGVKVFVKQLGARPYLPFYRNDDDDMEWVDNHRTTIWNGPGFKKNQWHESDGQPLVGSNVEVHLKDAKGGDMAEWPEDLRVREMPGQGQG